ncbi:hypothetical protein Pint_28669 [Pistacia integerrima]|uniref:Uncharacterized protein n=1 Tax=Pistacia integerrima TaxID=434235 RepID=A0ACC0YQF5_9ROSI|nr:hypothetical protein Pint_28669 [Pistacia integerrima]
MGCVLVEEICSGCFSVENCDECKSITSGQLEASGQLDELICV